MPDAETLLQTVKDAADAHRQFTEDAHSLAGQHAAEMEANRPVPATEPPPT